jgi:hypothetical protein
MSKTLLRHILTKNIFDIIVDFLIFILFHFMKIHRVYQMVLFKDVMMEKKNEIITVAWGIILYIYFIQWNLSKPNPE